MGNMLMIALTLDNYSRIRKANNRSIIKDASIAIPLIKGYRSIRFRNSRNNLTTQYMGNIISKCCCCDCKVAKEIKRELRRDKEVEVIYKQITGQTEETKFPCDYEEEYI